uniref:Uncharacterized protein n=1 Tax=Anguilla anguilla TaxID=7936 RepID=A0A0E9QTE1_ANGAN
MCKPPIVNSHYSTFKQLNYYKNTYSTTKTRQQNTEVLFTASDAACTLTRNLCFYNVLLHNIIKSVPHATIKLTIRARIEAGVN